MNPRRDIQIAQIRVCTAIGVAVSAFGATVVTHLGSPGLAVGVIAIPLIGAALALLLNRSASVRLILIGLVAVDVIFRLFCVVAGWPLIAVGLPLDALVMYRVVRLASEADLGTTAYAHLIEIDRVAKQFGGLRAVDDVSFNVDAGSIVAMIGPNGAGKTTAFNCLTGLYPLTEGDIRFKGISIAGLAPHRITKLGIARTFQNIRLFSYMTAIDNVMVGEHCRMRASIFDAILTTPRSRREERESEERAQQLLERLGIAQYAAVYARNLPYGLQRRLEIARALASRPDILLLDEPAAGLNPQEKKELMVLISGLRDSGLTIFLIEHDMRLVMEISDRIVVLDHGLKIAEGTPQEVRANPRVIEAYLGQGAAAAGA